jgi:dipeptidase E
VFVGGANSFRLLKRLSALGVLGELRARVLGASAGANLACPTIRTTNDMPIVDRGSFRALGLVPFQINPHYPYDEPAGPPEGKTRPQRIAEFLEENDVPVLALREGTWLGVSGEMPPSAGLPAAGYSGGRRTAGASRGIRRLRAVRPVRQVRHPEPTRQSAASHADPR